jgi:hypothetical protein
VGHQLATFENGEPVSWAVVEQRLGRDDAGEPFLEWIAERDHGEVESLTDHQLEHALEQDWDGAVPAAAALARATRTGLAVELVALEAGQAPDWKEASRYLESSILEELEDDLIEQCGVDTRHDPREGWLDTVKRRLRTDLESFRTDTEGLHDEIEEWDFEAAGSSPRSAASTTTRTHRTATAGCAGSWTRACFKRLASTARASRCCRSDSRRRRELRPGPTRRHPHASRKRPG